MKSTVVNFRFSQRFISTFLFCLALMISHFANSQTKEVFLGHGESVHVLTVKQNFDKISCAHYETPACVVYSSSGGFQLTISGTTKIRSSNFLRIARGIKAFQSQGICNQMVLSKNQYNQKDLTLFAGQSLLLDFSRGVETVTCHPSITDRQQLDKCYVKTHPISAASLYYKDFILDTQASLIRDDYGSLESKYEKILTEIGLCKI
ncbi:MAG: hypothetical protein ACK5V3_06615 [Bdellovibrionales bacterium]